MSKDFMQPQVTRKMKWAELDGDSGITAIALDDLSAEEHFPQPIFFGESDCAEHCDSCGEYLYGPQEEENDDDTDDEEN